VAVTEIYHQQTGEQCTFADGRDYLSKETKLKALNYFNDGLITLQAFPGIEYESPSIQKDLEKETICPTLGEGETPKLPLNEEEKEQILFVGPA
jgi:hypothetical protein